LEKSSNRKNDFLKPLIEKENLLKGTKIGRQLRQDLQSYNSLFPLDPIIGNFVNIFDDVASRLITIEIHERRKEIDLIHSYLDKYHSHFQLGFGKAIKSKGILNFNIDLIPRKIMEVIDLRT
jgi:hypothetical protein